MEPKEVEDLVAKAELRNPKQFNASRERYAIEIAYKAGYDEGREKGFTAGLHAEQEREWM